jgi:hypothetical protein
MLCPFVFKEKIDIMWGGVVTNRLLRYGEKDPILAASDIFLSIEGFSKDRR